MFTNNILKTMPTRRNVFFKFLGLAGLSAACARGDNLPVDPVVPGNPALEDLGSEPNPDPVSPQLRFAVCSDGHYRQPGASMTKPINGWRLGQTAKRLKMASILLFSMEMRFMVREGISPCKILYNRRLFVLRIVDLPARILYETTNVPNEGLLVKGMALGLYQAQLRTKSGEVLSERVMILRETGA
ncbi:hypothetical protein LZD49_33195 [Dyadobacter sp. CY261]|uniref:hypothetical protein n=1 Tax=Dyadobacter sp. CY261 TaxID=2907203 RepID=UPI001F30E4BE|nr:hypothetical protein [Dyadobacter sp. CY261]MCF0075382.1 hypothetical protein [Dyadobacter sp. CY261]